MVQLVEKYFLEVMLLNVFVFVIAVQVLLLKGLEIMVVNI
tara:strand:- start:2239 stop:2358 length:120 start_codon:yes stop_codon:yes gene_type:complete